MSEEPTGLTQTRWLDLLFPLLRTTSLRDDAAASQRSAAEAEEPDASRRKTARFATLVWPGPKPAESSYRADIDGLRAIAVLGVILLHAGATGLSGGFLGVDVFFVISGYLVHQQIVTRLRERNFSLFAFYGRRLRRTFPALYFVSAVTLAVGALILMPGDLDALARSAAAAALGVSNLLFAAQSGYFDHDAITKPLLHTWSLGVEEQFYLISPLIPFAIRGLSAAARGGLLLALLVIDLAFCVVLQRLIPEITFFMMPPRLWEFLIGALIAEGFMPAIRSRWIAELVAAAALAGLLLSMVWVSGNAAHPGLVTLVPCLATAALIHVGGTSKTFITRLLGAAPLAFCGLISYSLYLWHWPLVVLAQYEDLPASPTAFGFGAVLLLALSVLSWKYIETPFRDPASPLRRHAASILGSSLLVLLAVSGGVVGARGLPQRFSPRIAAITSYYDYGERRDFREGTCFITSKYGSARDFDQSECLQTSATQPNYLLIGDSEAAHLWAGFSKVFRNVHFLQATASGCKPLLGTRGLGYCVDLMRQTLNDYLPTAKLDGVIFSAAWKREDAAALKTTLDYTSKFVPHVIVLGKIPSYEADLPDLLGRSLAEHRPNLVREREAPYSKELDAALETVIDPSHFVSLVDLLCPENRCLVYASENVPLQFDRSHLTTEGSIVVAEKLARLAPFAALVEGRDRRAPK